MQRDPLSEYGGGEPQTPQNVGPILPRQAFKRPATQVADQVLPAGLIMQYAGSAAPDGWLLCDGRSLPRSTYSRLYNAIGVTYGTLTGETFTIPDLRGRTPLGVGTATGAAGATAHTLGQVGGEETHALTSGENGPHTHSLSFDNGTNSIVGGGSTGPPASAANVTTGGGSYAVKTASVASSGSGTGHNNLQPYVGLNFIIKY